MPYKIIRSLLFMLPPETAHDISLNTISTLARFKLLKSPKPTQKPLHIMGLDFPNQVGLAAGLDKNGEYIDGLSTLGFGFIEIGTVTPKPQPGNPQPRLFRIPKAQGLINRMGFNNHGVDYLIEQVKRTKYKGILGINIGKNADTPIENASDDYVICMKKVYPHASYITINISSPNTPGLRVLQYKESLVDLLSTLKQTQAELHTQHEKYVPLLIKIAPDLNDEELIDIANTLVEQKVDGVISSNTTLSREGVTTLPHGVEKGGLSGEPLFEKSLHNIKTLSSVLKGEITLVACGGINSKERANEMLNAGADLIQIYTGFIYKGPKLIKDCLRTINKDDNYGHTNPNQNGRL